MPLGRGLKLSKASRGEGSGFTKTRASPKKYISSSVGVTKSRAFAAKPGQNISSSLGVTRSRAFAAKSGQNISSSV